MADQSITFSFKSLPTSVDELNSMPEISLDTPFKTAALAIAVLCNFEKNAGDTYAMLDVLRGPAPLSPMEKQFLKDRLTGKYYKPFSFFQGSSPENGYQVVAPFTITICDNPYSYSEENWATLYLQSSGADSLRPLRLRKKPSTGQWFINEIQCLADIRIPVCADPWA